MTSDEIVQAVAQVFTERNYANPIGAARNVVEYYFMFVDITRLGNFTVGEVADRAIQAYTANEMSACAP